MSVIKLWSLSRVARRRENMMNIRDLFQSMSDDCPAFGPVRAGSYSLQPTSFFAPAPSFGHNHRHPNPLMRISPGRLRASHTKRTSFRAARLRRTSETAIAP
jgi:hypothetical protein